MSTSWATPGGSKGVWTPTGIKKIDDRTTVDDLTRLRTTGSAAVQTQYTPYKQLANFGNGVSFAQIQNPSNSGMQPYSWTRLNNDALKYYNLDPNIMSAASAQPVRTTKLDGVYDPAQGAGANFSLSNKQLGASPYLGAKFDSPNALANVNLNQSGTQAPMPNALLDARASARTPSAAAGPAAPAATDDPRAAYNGGQTSPLDMRKDHRTGGEPQTPQQPAPTQTQTGNGGLTQDQINYLTQLFSQLNQPSGATVQDSGYGFESSPSWQWKTKQAQGNLDAWLRSKGRSNSDLAGEQMGRLYKDMVWAEDQVFYDRLMDQTRIGQWATELQNQQDNMLMSYLLPLYTNYGNQTANDLLNYGNTMAGYYDQYGQRTGGQDADFANNMIQLYSILYGGASENAWNWANPASRNALLSGQNNAQLATGIGNAPAQFLTLWKLMQGK